MWAAPSLPLQLNLVRVPSFSPSCSIIVDGGEEEPMEEPDVGRIFNIKAVVGLQAVEEVFPLTTKPFSHIVPQSLNPGVVDTSVEE